MDALFWNRSIFDLQQAVQDSAGRVADKFSEHELKSNTLEELVQPVVDECTPPRIELDLAGHHVTREQVSLPAHTNLEFAGLAIAGGGQAPYGVCKSRCTSLIGDKQMFTITPTQQRPNPPRASVYDDRLVLTFTFRGAEETTRLLPEIERREAELAE